jgi:hypothetical protein
MPSEERRVAAVTPRATPRAGWAAISPMGTPVAAWIHDRTDGTRPAHDTRLGLRDRMPYVDIASNSVDIANWRQAAGADSVQTETVNP